MAFNTTASEELRTVESEATVEELADGATALKPFFNLVGDDTADVELELFTSDSGSPITVTGKKISDFSSATDAYELAILNGGTDVPDSIAVGDKRYIKIHLVGDHASSIEVKLFWEIGDEKLVNSDFTTTLPPKVTT